MSEPAPTRMRKRTMIVIAIALVVLVVPPALGLILRPPPRSDLTLGTDLAPAVRAERERTVAAHVEREQNKKWQTTSSDGLRCAVQELGEEPVRDEPGRTRVYVWALCQTVDRVKSGFSGPRSVDIGGRAGPVTSFEPEDGAGYAPSIRENFPRQLYDAAIDQKGVDLQRLERELKQRP